jgi:hypothetical protein
MTNGFGRRNAQPAAARAPLIQQPAPPAAPAPATVAAPAVDAGLYDDLAAMAREVGKSTPQPKIEKPKKAEAKRGLSLSLIVRVVVLISAAVRLFYAFAGHH